MSYVLPMPIESSGRLRRSRMLPARHRLPSAHAPVSGPHSNIQTLRPELRVTGYIFVLLRKRSLFVQMDSTERVIVPGKRRFRNNFDGGSRQLGFHEQKGAQ